jgi:hypothetical protein
MLLALAWAHREMPEIHLDRHALSTLTQATVLHERFKFASMSSTFEFTKFLNTSEFIIMINSRQILNLS